jgi:hypothetical protein
MKIAPSLVAGVLSLSALLSTSPSATALDLSPLAGHYKGTAKISPTGELPITGDISITAQRVANGDNRVRVKINGYGAIPESSPKLYVALTGNFTLSKTHGIKANNALIAFLYRLPANSRFGGNHQRLTFRLKSNFDGTVVDMHYTLRFNGTKLSIVGDGTLGGFPVSVSVQGTKVN